MYFFYFLLSGQQSINSVKLLTKIKDVPFWQHGGTAGVVRLLLQQGEQ